MVTKNYNILVSEENPEECYMQFIKKYKKNLKIIGHGQLIYDLNDSAVIITLNDEEINKKITNNLTLIGKKESIEEIIKEIKSKKFLLEEIAN